MSSRHWCIIMVLLIKIGNAEYCAIGPLEVHCVDHTLSQCLRTLELIPDGTKCIKNNLK